MSHCTGRWPARPASRPTWRTRSTPTTPTATIRTHLKDVGIISAFAAELGCALPVYQAATQLYLAGEALGFGARDTASVCAVLEAMHGIARNGCGEPT